VFTARYGLIFTLSIILVVIFDAVSALSADLAGNTKSGYLISVS
jgi:hypothetical protein